MEEVDHDQVHEAVLNLNESKGGRAVGISEIVNYLRRQQSDDEKPISKARVRETVDELVAMGRCQSSRPGYYRSKQARTPSKNRKQRRVTIKSPPSTSKSIEKGVGRPKKSKMNVHRPCPKSSNREFPSQSKRSAKNGRSTVTTQSFSRSARSSEQSISSSKKTQCVQVLKNPQVALPSSTSSMDDYIQRVMKMADEIEEIEAEEIENGADPGLEPPPQGYGGDVDERKSSNDDEMMIQRMLKLANDPRVFFPSGGVAQWVFDAEPKVTYRRRNVRLQVFYVDISPSESSQSSEEEKDAVVPSTSAHVAASPAIPMFPMAMIPIPIEWIPSKMPSNGPASKMPTKHRAPKTGVKVLARPPISKPSTPISTNDRDVRK